MPAGPPGQGWELVFHDEFNGKQLNWDTWLCEKGDRRNAYNDPEDTYLDGKGHLLLRVRKGEDGKYHLGFIRTRKLFGQGFYEARATLDTVPGYWSAFWLMGPKAYSPDHSGAEVDIMEDPKRDDTVSLNIHQGEGPTRIHQGSPAKIRGARADWHLFSCDWHEKGFDLFVDGEAAWATRTMKAVEPNRICLTQEAQFQGWAGDIRNSEHLLPAYWSVDYVRYYRKNAEAPVLNFSGKPAKKSIRLELANGRFVDRLHPENWSVENLPVGVSLASVKRAGDREVVLKLKGKYKGPLTVIAESGEVAGSKALLIAVR
jgi:beta-glucanase (GH16 family)